MNKLDPDCQTVIALTLEWTQCVAAKNVGRVRDLLTEDFIYSQHPTLGGQQLSKEEILAFMLQIEESETSLIEQHAQRCGDVIVLYNLTRANQKVAVDGGGQSGRSFLSKLLIDSAGWRKVDGTWRCFDYRLIDAVDAGASANGGGMIVDDPDPDAKAVVERTDLWMQCAVDGKYQRLGAILADDFVYSGHPKYGVERMDKGEMIKLASMLKDNGTEKYEQRLFRVGNVISSYTVTRSEEVITGDMGSAASSDEMNASMNGKILVYGSGWRKEDKGWRCFDMHLIEAIDPSTVQLRGAI